MGKGDTASAVVKSAGKHQRQHTHITKTERYVELLLLAGPTGVPSIDVATKVPTPNSSSYMRNLRLHVDAVSRPNHALPEIRQAVDALAYLDTLRLKRGAERYPANVLKGWFS